MTFALTMLAGSVVVAVGFLLPVVAKRIRDHHSHGPWNVVGMDYTPPDRSWTSLKGQQDNPVVRDLLYGYTVLTDRCVGCGEVRTRKLTGQAKVDASVVTP